MSCTLSELRARPHTSVSALKTYLQCPRKFRLKYIDREKPAFKPVALAFGTAWHVAIGAYLQASKPGDVLGVGDVLSVFTSTLQSELEADDIPVLFDDDQDTQRLLETASKMIAVFAQKVPLPSRVLGIEQAYAMNITDPDTGDPLLPLIGSIDAVVEYDGRMEGWELKSACKKWSADQLEFDMQPTAEKMGLRALDYHCDVVMVITTKTQKPDVQIERVTRGVHDDTDLVATIASVERAVAAGVDHPVRGWGCRGCPYAGMCQ